MSKKSTSQKLSLSLDQDDVAVDDTPRLGDIVCYLVPEKMHAYFGAEICAAIVASVEDAPMTISTWIFPASTVAGAMPMFLRLRRDQWMWPSSLARESGEPTAEMPRGRADLREVE